MGNYATHTDVVQRLDGSGLTEDLINDLCKTSNATLKETYLEFLITNAEGLMNAFLNKHYTTPIVTDQSNGFLKELTLDITEYELWKRSLGDDVPTKIKESKNEAMDILKMIVEGTLSPFGSDGSKNSSIDIETDTMRFDEESLEVF